MKKTWAVALLLAGCATGPAWVTPGGGPVDPLVELRCEEYVASQNPVATRPGVNVNWFGPLDYDRCMRAHGYVRP